MWLDYPNVTMDKPGVELRYTGQYLFHLKPDCILLTMLTACCDAQIIGPTSVSVSDLDLHVDQQEIKEQMKRCKSFGSL